MNMRLMPLPPPPRVPALGSEDEERLVADLFFGYNKLIRPVENMTKTVNVEFGLAFIQLISVVSGERVGW